MENDIIYCNQPYGTSKRLKLTETCQRSNAIMARRYSTETALLQIFILEGEQSIRMTNAHLNRQNCLDMAETLQIIAAQLKDTPQS